MRKESRATSGGDGALPSLTSLAVQRKSNYLLELEDQVEHRVDASDLNGRLDRNPTTSTMEDIPQLRNSGVRPHVVEDPPTHWPYCGATTDRTQQPMLESPALMASRSAQQNYALTTNLPSLNYERPPTLCERSSSSSRQHSGFTELRSCSNAGSSRLNRESESTPQCPNSVTLMDC
jgi:hypothetical protein